jgi:hypothetical protein
MVKLTGISGSLRRASFNTALPRAAAAPTPDGSKLEIKNRRRMAKSGEQRRYFKGDRQQHPLSIFGSIGSSAS